MSELEEIRRLLLELETELARQKNESDERHSQLKGRFEIIRQRILKSEAPPPVTPKPPLQPHVPPPAHPVQAPITPPKPPEPSREDLRLRDSPLAKNSAPSEPLPPRRPRPPEEPSWQDIIGKIFQKQKNQFREKFKGYDWKQWELFIGTNWLSRIGMIVVALGLMFFMKYSFDQNYISPSVRIVMAMALGFVCYGLGERFYRKQYRAQSQVFIGGGSLILYAAVLVAKNFPFQSGVVLESAPLAILFMVLITAVTYLFAYRYDSAVIAAIGMIGGFLAPLIVGKPSGQALPLLGYLAILSSASCVLEYKKNWRKLLHVTLFLSFVEPLVLNFLGPEQHGQLLVYLLLVGIGGIWISSRKGYENLGYFILGCITLIPIVGFFRTVGNLAHPLLVYIYCLVSTGLMLWLAAKRSMARLSALACAAGFALPFFMINYVPDYVRAHHAWFILLPLVYYFLVVAGNFYLVHQKRISFHVLWIEVGAVFWPTLVFIKSFHVLFAFFGLHSTGFGADFSSLLTLFSFVYVLVIVYLASLVRRSSLVFLLPASYIVIKFTVDTASLVTAWPLVFILSAVLSLYGLWIARAEKHSLLANIATACGWIFPMAVFAQFPVTIQMQHVFLYGIFLMSAHLMACVHNSWRNAGLIAIAGAFLHPWLGHETMSLYVGLLLIQGAVLLCISHLAAYKVRENWFSLLALIGAALLPLITRSTTLQNHFHFIYGYYLFLGLTSLAIADLRQWRKLNLFSCAIWLVMPVVVNAETSAHPYLTAAYGITLTLAALASCYRREWDRIAIYNLLAGFASLLVLQSIASQHVLFIYGCCGVLALAGYAYATLRSTAKVALAATFAAFTLPLILYNQAVNDLQAVFLTSSLVFIYSTVVLVMAFAGAFMRGWKNVVLFAVVFALGAPLIASLRFGSALLEVNWGMYFVYFFLLATVAFVACAAFGIKHAWERGLQFGLAAVGVFIIAGLAIQRPLILAHDVIHTISLAYGLLLLLPVVVISHLKNWRPLANHGCMMALVFGMASILSFHTPQQQQHFLIYLVIMNVIVLSLALIKDWQELIALPFFGVAVLTSPINFHAGESAGLSYPVVIGFLTIFFLLYFVAGWMATLRTKKVGGTLILLFMLLLPAYYYGWLYHLLKTFHPALVGPAAVGVAVLYLLQALAILKKSSIHSIEEFKQSAQYRAILILMGIVFALVTIAIPLQLNPKLVTIAWALEAMLVVWAGFRLDDSHVRRAGKILTSLTVARFFIRDTVVPGTSVNFLLNVAQMGHYAASYTPFLSVRFASGLFVTALLFWMVYWRSRKPENHQPVLTGALFVLTNILLLWLLCSETAAYFVISSPEEANIKYRQLIYSMIGSLHASALLVLGFYARNSFCRLLALISFAVVLLKIFIKDIWAFDESIRILAFILLGVLLLVSSLLYSRYRSRLTGMKEES